ncbi:MAG: biopolymer transporter Tol [Chitinophagaceae bacterium]
MKIELRISKKSSNLYKYIRTIKNTCLSLLPAMFLCATSYQAYTQTAPAKVEVPDWALPSSATHKQVPPPSDFHRPTRTENKGIGIFQGQSDVGAALVPGSSRYNAATGQYIINSAGYNIWYTRDEFRYLWTKMSGDVSLAANIIFPDTAGFFDRKAVLIIRQNLDDDSKEAMVALHGAGLVHLAWRPEKGESIKQMRVDKKGALRLGIEKRGDAVAIFVSQAGEPLHQFGEPIQLHIQKPFYVGIGFCSHLPDKVDTAILSDVVLENAAGKVR